MPRNDPEMIKQLVHGGAASQAETTAPPNQQKAEPTTEQEQTALNQTPADTAENAGQGAGVEKKLLKGLTKVVSFRMPLELVAMMEEFDENYASRKESKNAIVVEAVRKEYVKRLKKARAGN